MIEIITIVGFTIFGLIILTKVSYDKGYSDGYEASTRLLLKLKEQDDAEIQNLILNMRNIRDVTNSRQLH